MNDDIPAPQFERPEKDIFTRGMHIYGVRTGRISYGACPCACHNGTSVHHIMPCHTPLLKPGDPSLPRYVE